MNISKSHISSIPISVYEIVEKRFKNGNKYLCSYYQSGRLLGKRIFYESGGIEREWGIFRGRREGKKYYFHENGNIIYACSYSGGKLHGEAKQWTRSGRLLSISYFERGTGLELWCLNFGRKVVLSEERYYREGSMDGPERWWNHDGRTIFKESNWKKGMEHGIMREWDEGRGLKKTYPWFFIYGRRVEKSEYISHYKRMGTLPEYRKDDDDDVRELPLEYSQMRETIKKAEYAERH